MPPNEKTEQEAETRRLSPTDAAIEAAAKAIYEVALKEAIGHILTSISPRHRDLFEVSIKPALNDYLSGTTLSDILVEYDKRERLFFVVECAFIIHRLVAEMCVFPEAQRQQINPIDVMRDFETMPENLKETKRGTARLLLHTTGSTFGLGFYLERRSDAAAT